MLGFMNIFQLVLNEKGETIGAFKVADNVDNAVAVARIWSEDTNYEICYHAMHCSAPRARYVDGVWYPTAGAI